MGRPPNKPKEPTDESSEQQFTPPNDEANTDNKRVRDRTGERERAAARKNKGGDILTVGECEEKIFMIYKLFGKVARSPEQHRQKDFVDDAAILSRLSEKYAVIGMVLKSLDPLFFIVGVSNKFSHHVSEWMNKRKVAKEAKDAARGNGVTVVTNQDLNADNNFSAH